MMVLDVQSAVLLSSFKKETYTLTMWLSWSSTFIVPGKCSCILYFICVRQLIILNAFKENDQKLEINCICQNSVWNIVKIFSKGLFIVFHFKNQETENSFKLHIKLFSSLYSCPRLINDVRSLKEINPPYQFWTYSN